MECPNCSFQNTPGTRSCVRCQALLDLDAVDFVPPRAAMGRPARRARAVAQTARFRMADAMADVGRSLRLPADFRVAWHEVAWSLIPGGAQIRSPVRGLRVLGRVVLSIWVFILLLATVFVGTGFGSVLCFGLVSVHCFAISLVFAAPLQAQPMVHRLVVGIALYFAVLFGLYWPASAALRNVAAILPVSNVHRQQAIADGDVLLRTSRWTRPRAWHRGDLVVVAIDSMSAPGVIIAEGFNVDRILALPGDRVHMEPGVLLINDEAAPSDHWPLGGLSDLPRLDLTAGPDDYIVLPSVLRWRIHGDVTMLRSGLLGQLAHVPEDRLLGKVLVRVRPWSRLGVVGGAAQ
ncbi:MAG TPA: S26 family signal peptidase [Phycisphaerales bacterium]|nr:S26 family signal peptidase [Phycisphaerales bacterium]